MQPGENYGHNEGLNLLFQAATQQARRNLIKHQEIEQRKTDVFKNLGDLSSVQVMPEDRQQLNDQFKEVAKYLLDPSIFSGGNEAGRAAYEQKFEDLARKTYTSKQDFLMHSMNKKIIAENPEYQNAPNAQYLAAYPKTPLGSRTYDGMIPTPKFDYEKGIVIPSQIGAVKDVPDVFEIGDVVTRPDGTQDFTLNPNGKWTRETNKVQSVDAGQIEKQANFLKEQMWGVIKPDLDFKFQHVYTPELKKKFSVNGDGVTPDYDKMYQPVIDLAISTAKSKAGDTKFHKNDVLQFEDSEAGKNYRARLHAAKPGSTEDGAGTGNDFDAVAQNVAPEDLANSGLVRKDGKFYKSNGDLFTGDIDVNVNHVPATIAGAIKSINKNDDLKIKNIEDKNGDVVKKRATFKVIDGVIVSTLTSNGLQFSRDNQITGQRTIDKSTKAEGPAPFGTKPPTPPAVPQTTIILQGKVR